MSKKTIIKNILFVFFLCNLFGCKTSSSNNSNRITSELSAFPTELGGTIEGNWTLSCKEGLGAPGYYQHSYDFSSGNTLKYENYVYNDDSCSSAISESICSGSYQVDSTTGTLDTKCSELKIKLLNQDLVDAYNNKNICSKTWSLDQVVTLSPSDCSSNEISKEFAKVFNNYQIYLVKNNSLFFGYPDAIYTGTSADKRPRRLLFAMPYIQ